MSVGYYFQENRSIATGLVACGCAVAMLAFPPILHFSIYYYGIHGTFLLLSAMMFQCVVFGALMRPNSFEINRKLQKHRMIPEKADDRCSKIHSAISKHIKDLVTIPFLLFCLSTFSWNVSFNFCNLYFPTYFKTRGVSLSNASYLISATGIGNICTRFLTGFAANDVMIGSRLLFFGTFSLIGLLTLFLPLYNNYTMYFIYMTCFGLYTGGVWVLMSMIIVELVGVSQLASAFGMVMLVAGFGQLVVPFIGGKICS